MFFQGAYNKARRILRDAREALLLLLPAQLHRGAGGREGVPWAHHHVHVHVSKFDKILSINELKKVIWKAGKYFQYAFMIFLKIIYH